MPSNYGAKETEKILARLERSLARLYADSKKELEEAVDNYYNGWYEEVGGGKVVYHQGLLERRKAELEAYKDGKYHDPSGTYTDEEMFSRWWWAQEGRGKELEKMRDDMARYMTETNQRAVAMINDKTPQIYSLNANWEAYKIEVVRKNDDGKWIREVARRDFDNGTTLGVSFDLVNEQTVKELALNKNHSEFRVNSINPKRDYDWNYNAIQKALATGVILGESPYEIAHRYLTVMHRNRSASIRNARTSVTSAQNAGTQHTYERAKEMGIKIQKQWMATADQRTRISHIMANGQIVDIDDKFSVGDDKLLYPAHPDGAPEEVYNCRCTMVTVDPAVLKVNGDPYDVQGFKEWVKEHRKDVEQPEEEQKEVIKESTGDANSIDSCRTIEDVVKLLKGKDWYYKTTVNGKPFNSGDYIKLDGCDLECAKEVYKSQETLFNKYPWLIGQLNSVVTDPSLGANTEASCFFGFGHGGVQLNTKFFKNYEKFSKSLKEEAETKWSFQGVNVQGIVLHEFGHAIEDLLVNTYNVMGFDKRGKAKKLSSYMRPKIMKMCGLDTSYQSVRDNVSEYATSSVQEWFAECFGEYMVMGDKARPVAREFGKMLEEIMKKTENEGKKK